MSAPGTRAPGGLVALGDSITNGEGGSVMGVYCRSWAHWLARAMDLPFHGLAHDGATVQTVITAQLPRVRSGESLAAIYVGVNDVRAADFAPERFREGVATVLAHVAPRAQRLAVCTLPLDLGRPRAGAAKVTRANTAIRELAAQHGAVLVALDDLRGPTRVWPDGVHPNAVGQLEIADRAAAALGVHPPPSAAVTVDHSPRTLARFAATTLFPAVLRDRRRRVTEARGRRRA